METSKFTNESGLSSKKQYSILRMGLVKSHSILADFIGNGENTFPDDMEPGVDLKIKDHKVSDDRKSVKISFQLDVRYKNNIAQFSSSIVTIIEVVFSDTLSSEELNSQDDLKNYMISDSVNLFRPALNKLSLIYNSFITDNGYVANDFINLVDYIKDAEITELG